MDLATTTKLERENLEAHVDLCAQRYSQLDQRLITLEEKVDQIILTLAASKNSLANVIITASATTVASIIGLIVTILLKF
jgi:hypothetical protein